MASKKRKQTQENGLAGLWLKPIHPKTAQQSATFGAYPGGLNLFLHGVAGTGKTFLAMYLALKDLIQGITHKVYIVRSTVEVRPVGFLPGELEEKLDPYEQPYADICSELTERENAYQNLKDKGHLQFVSTSFLRGVTFNDCIVIVDEAQNMTFQELDTVSTRVGKNCRIMFCSDQAQSDLQTAKEKSGLPKFAAILKLMESVLSIEFGVEDIVRSGFVKEYLLAKMAIPST